MTKFEQYVLEECKRQWKDCQEEIIRVEEDHYIPSACNGDYSPTHPWDAPGMSVHDFI